MYKESDEENMKTKNATQQSAAARRITADPQLRLVFKLLLFELNKPLINTRPLPYEAHI